MLKVLSNPPPLIKLREKLQAANDKLCLPIKCSGKRVVRKMRMENKQLCYFNNLTIYTANIFLLNIYIIRSHNKAGTAIENIGPIGPWKNIRII